MHQIPILMDLRFSFMFEATTKQPMARQPESAARQLVVAIKQPVAMARQTKAKQTQPKVVERQPVEL